MQDSNPPPPMVARRRLRLGLRQLRERAGLARESVARELQCSLSKVIRIENGTNAVSLGDIYLLLRLYGYPELIDQYELLARNSRLPSPSLDPNANLINEHESISTHLRFYAPLQIPPPLWTEDYARLLSREPSSIPHRIPLDMIQRDHENHPTEIIVSECVVRRLSQAGQSHLEQLRSLHDLATEGRSASLFILPEYSDPSPAFSVGYELIEFESDADEQMLIVVDQHWNEIIVEDWEETRRAQEEWVSLTERSMDAASSAALLEAALRRNS